ncbi:MAG: exodeoxyribonuclease VII small subunit, partial [Acidobacteriota bacterium]
MPRPDTTSGTPSDTRKLTQDETFEGALSALERIVKQLESGELPLEQALELFESGLGLA